MRLIVLILLLTGCQEFTSAAHVDVIDSDSGYSVSVPDGHIDRMVGHVAPDVYVPKPPTTDTGVVPPDKEPIDTGADVPQGSEDGGQQPEDGGQVPTKPEAGPTYCIDCQPVLGRPPCCSVYHVCGHLNGLNQCTRN